MKTITPLELSNRLAKQLDLTLIDVRTAMEFDGSHIKQAIHAPLDELDPESWFAERQFAPTQPVHIICQSGPRSIKAAGKFLKVGYDNVIVIEGGTQAWIDAGLPVDHGPRNVIGLERQVRIVAGSLVLSGVLLGRFVHPAIYGVSAFVGAGLIFAGVTNWCGMGLLLAKAPWNKRRES